MVMFLQSPSLTTGPKDTCSEFMSFRTPQKRSTKPGLGQLAFCRPEGLDQNLGSPSQKLSRIKRHADFFWRVSIKKRSKVFDLFWYLFEMVLGTSFSLGKTWAIWESRQPSGRSNTWGRVITPDILLSSRTRLWDCECEGWNPNQKGASSRDATWVSIHVITCVDCLF